MRKLVCFMLCVAVIASFACACNGNEGAVDGIKSKELLEANREFSFDVFKIINEEDSEKNVFISPLSISLALSMVYNGAKGDTKDAIAEALSYTGIGMGELNSGQKYLQDYLEKLDKKIELNISNSIWVLEGSKPRQDFMDLSRDVFDAYVEEADFSKLNAADKINNWISKATKGKIDKMLNPPLPPGVVMYLINAIYFKGEWTQQFDRDKTFDGMFTSEDGSRSDIKMMSRKDTADFGSGDGYKVLRLPYGKGKAAMYLILPEEGTPINDFAGTLTVDKWETIKGSIEETEDVVVQVPRFKLKYGTKELNTALDKMGMGIAFAGAADFSGIMGGIFINRVLHKAYIEVNEEGTEAAAATIVEMLKSAAVEPITFIADRPFLFLIADEEDGNILFMGKVNSL